MIGKPWLFSILLLIAATGRNFAQSAPRSDAEIQQAVDSLLQKMTTEEKIGQLSQLFVFDAGETVEKSVAMGEVGSLLFITDPAITADHLVVLADNRGPRLLAVLNTVSARLTTGSLRALDARVELRGQDPRLVAESWLQTQGLAPVGEASQ